MHWWLMRSFGAVPSVTAGAVSYQFWFYGGAGGVVESSVVLVDSNSFAVVDLTTTWAF